MEQYKTIQGDTWDSIAHKVYGDEMKADLLMQNNPKLLDIAVFPAGVIVSVPTLPMEDEELPDWRD